MKVVITLDVPINHDLDKRPDDLQQFTPSVDQIVNILKQQSNITIVDVVAGVSYGVQNKTENKNKI